MGLLLLSSSLTMVRVKAVELRNKDKDALVSQLGELRKELSQLRVAQVTGSSPSKLAQIKVVRKSIARVNTVISQTQRQQLRLHFKNAKYAPTDLRAKKTRALRRAMTKSEKAIKTERQKKKLAHFPKRKFA